MGNLITVGGTVILGILLIEVVILVGILIWLLIDMIRKG